MSKHKLCLVIATLLLSLPGMAFAQGGQAGQGGKSKVATLTSISPNFGTASSSGFTLTVNGSNFSSGSVVLWNGATMSTTYVSQNQVTAAISSAQLASVGTVQVTVYAPGRWGGTSNSLAFTVNAPSTSSTGTTSVTSLVETTTSPLPTGSTGSTYNASLLATGGAPPYQWGVASGTLPPGLAMATSGGISGTPTSAGNYSFVAQVTDTTSNTATQTFSLTVATPTTTSGTSTLAITTASLPGGTVGVAYSATLAATGGTTPYVWSTTSTGGALPAGVVLASTGTISGTPTASGTYSFGVQVQDATSSTATKSYSVTIGTSTTTTSTSTCINGTYGNCGDPYEGKGGPPPTATNISACGTFAPTSGQYYLVTQNLGSDATAQCITINYGGNFTLDLGGHTVTGGINGYTNNLSNSVIFNGTVNCNINNSSAGINGCVEPQSNAAPTALARIHHLTVENFAVGGLGISVVWQPTGNSIGTMVKIDHVTSTVGSQPTSGRCGNIGASGPFITAELAFNYVTCPSDASACQGLVVGAAPNSSIHDNYVVLQHPTYDINMYDTARGIMFDSEGKYGVAGTGGNSAAYNNIIYTDQNRAFRVRAESGDKFYNNSIYDCRLGGTLACIHIGDTDFGTEASSAEIYGNSIELQDGVGVVVAGSNNETAYVHDNTFTCYLGNCATVPYAAQTMVTHSNLAGATMTIKNSTIPAGLLNAVLACGPTGNTAYICPGPTTVNYCSTGNVVGNGTIIQQCP